MSFDLDRLRQEIQIFQKMPEVLRATGFCIETIDENAFIIKNKPNSDLSAFNTDKKYELILSALIHGNEVSGIAVLNRVLQKILNKEIKIQHSAGFCVHNVPASLQNKRFLETDVNRSFLNNKNSTAEEKLARRAEAIFKDFQFCIDLHQTNQPSLTPFFIFYYTNKSMHWARFLNEKVPAIVSNKERHKDGSTLEFYCFKSKTIGVTIELGVAGFYEDQIQFGTELLAKAFQAKDFNFNIKHSFSNVYRVLESVYWTDTPIVLEAGLVNFAPVKINQRLGTVGDTDYFSKYNGVILFPKYGEIAKNTKEVFTVAEPINTLP